MPQQFLAGWQRIGDRLFAPDMLTCLQGLSVQMLMLLHVREDNQEVERCSCKHFVNVPIVMRHAEPSGLGRCSFRTDIADADKLDIGTLRQASTSAIRSHTQ